jgi:SAM-dependent methyltransferase
MQSQLRRLGKKVVKRLPILGRLYRAGKKRGSEQFAQLYEKYDFLEAYARHTDERVAKDPHQAIGGAWEEIGQLQFDFLKRRGLQPHHRMLDVGCGTLRGGRHAIRHLEPGHYTGMDISPKALEYARELVRKEGLAGKRPRLVLSKRKDLQFREFAGEKFDYMLAQSVFTHLMPEHIQECFAHIGGIMNDRSTFYFTYGHGDEYRQTGLKNFKYPFSFFEELAARHGFRVEDCSAQYPHPRGQRMVALTRRSQSPA